MKGHVYFAITPHFTIAYVYFFFLAAFLDHSARNLFNTRSQARPSWFLVILARVVAVSRGVRF